MAALMFEKTEPFTIVTIVNALPWKELAIGMICLAGIVLYAWICCQAPHWIRRIIKKLRPK
ncbi:MAG: hypothetical protein JST16_14175 [Bdellovibrionales bacterium]|nr:hypothetical protein [Bdellovibrionales bacterium]